MNERAFVNLSRSHESTYYLSEASLDYTFEKLVFSSHCDPGHHQNAHLPPLIDSEVHEDRLARQNKRIDTLNAVLDGQQHALAEYHAGKNAAVDGDSCASSED